MDFKKSFICGVESGVKFKKTVYRSNSNNAALFIPMSQDNAFHLLLFMF